MKNKFTLKVGDKNLTFDRKIALLDLIDSNEDKKYLCAKVNNRIRELTYEVFYDADF